MDGGCKINEIEMGIILYADDTVLVFDNPKKLQLAVNQLNQYCMNHEIQINIPKTNIFSTNKM